MTKARRRRAAGSGGVEQVPAGSGAKVAPGAPVVLLESYAKAWNLALREVYRRCVIGTEAWFVPAGGGMPTSGVRSELIERGWSQREANGMFVSAKGAQSSAVESTEMALERSRQDLEVLEEQLSAAKRREKDKPKRDGMSRRQNRLRARVAELGRRLELDDVRVCFGSRRLAVAGNDPTASGFVDRAQWRDAWDRARSANFCLHGDSESDAGNYSARIRLSADGRSDVVELRVPVFLRHLSGGAEWVEMAVVGFREKNRRGMLAWAMDPDLPRQRTALADRDRHRRIYEAQLSARDDGQEAPLPKAPPKTDPKLRCHCPVTVRFTWSSGHAGWHVQASFDRPVRKPVERAPSLVLGADLNPDHIAWSLVNAHGNPLRWGRIELDLSGSADQNTDNIGVAVAALCQLARTHGAAIAVERLDFTKARAQLRYASRRLKRLLSSFAYNKFFQILVSRTGDEDLDVIRVNPAWTSVLGQANYSAVHGVSVDQGAACVIARRALGLGTTVRPQVAARLPRSGAGAGASQEHAGLKLLARSLPRRRSTWDPSGLCSRSTRLDIEPPSKDTDVAAPCPPSDPPPESRPSQPQASSRSHTSAPLRRNCPPRRTDEQEHRTKISSDQVLK